MENALSFSRPATSGRIIKESSGCSSLFRAHHKAPQMFLDIACTVTRCQGGPSKRQCITAAQNDTCGLPLHVTSCAACHIVQPQPVNSSAAMPLLNLHARSLRHFMMRRNTWSVRMSCDWCKRQKRFTLSELELTGCRVELPSRQGCQLIGCWFDSPFDRAWQPGFFYNENWKVSITLTSCN